MINQLGLAKLYEDIRDDPSFEVLRQPGIVLVPGIGPDVPKVMAVGEAPGATENAVGRPFCGASGRVLQQLMNLAGLAEQTGHLRWRSDRDVDGVSISPNTWITNVIKYRPPGNRTPTPYEIEKAKPYLRREWQLIGRPEVLVAVGAVAWLAIGRPELGGITRVAGNPVDVGRTRTVWPMLHPAFGMRNERARPTMEEHWVRFGQWLREEGIIS